jgi:hypothetical protein
MDLPFNISRIDRLGAGVSFVCAIHCAIVPFAATILPLLGIGFLADERIERTVLFTSIALACASVCWGIRLHRQRRILLLFGAALFLIMGGHQFGQGTTEIVPVVMGAALFSSGHLLNRHLCRSCKTRTEAGLAHMRGALHNK